MIEALNLNLRSLEIIADLLIEKCHLKIEILNAELQKNNARINLILNAL